MLRLMYDYWWESPSHYKNLRRPFLLHEPFSRLDVVPGPLERDV
jgi:hypothetical protein